MAGRQPHPHQQPAPQYYPGPDPRRGAAHFAGGRGHYPGPPPARAAAAPLVWDGAAYREGAPAHRAPAFRDEPPTRNARGEGLDVHELLKREAFGAPEPACDDHFEKSRPCPEAPYGISDQYIVLDSFSKLRSSRLEAGEIQWNFMVQGVTGDEVVGVRDKIDTVIEVQIGSFTLPFLPEVPYEPTPGPIVPTGVNRVVLVHNNDNTTIPSAAGPNPPLLPPTQYPVTLPPFLQVPWVNNPYTQVPCGGRLTVQLREAGLQSYSDRFGARHHFEFTASYLSLAGVGANPGVLTAVPMSGAQWDTFVFTDPLKDVHGLTLVFRNPDVPIRFQPDCLYDVTADSDGAGAPGPFLRFGAPRHGLAAGDRIFVEGFRSGAPALDSYVNRAEGHAVGGDPSAPPVPAGMPLALAPAPGPYPDVFWLDPAVSLIDLTSPPPALPQLVTVCVAKRRVRIPVRIRRVVPRLTNYIQV